MYTQNSLPTDSTTGAFPIGFSYLKGSTIQVQRVGADGESNPITLAFSFVGTVSEAQPSGSAITLAVAQPAGYMLVIRKVVDMDTPVVIWNTGAEITQKNLRNTTTNLMEMAQTAQDAATRVLNPLIDATQSAISAATSAAEALQRKNEALNSATNAYTAWQDALQSKNAALIAETNAYNSSVSALASKNAANTSESNANTSATNANLSKNEAAVSASTAVTKAGEASTSASQALASKNAAGTSETNAALSAASVAALSAASGTGFRNKLIGGNFSTNPFQRGTSIAAVANLGYVADRWRWNFAGSGVVTIQRTVDAPTAAQAGMFTQHCLDVVPTTADAAIAASDVYSIVQAIEGNNAAPFGFGQAGLRYVTLSFWVRASVTGVSCVSFINSAADRSYIAEYTINASNTWEYKVITIPVDTAGTWLYDASAGLLVRFALACGTTFQTPTPSTWVGGNMVSTANQVNHMSATTNRFKLALVQLELGQTATAFEARSIGHELALCQRYYYFASGIEYLARAYDNAAAGSLLTVWLPVTMRSAPSATATNNASDVVSTISTTSTKHIAVKSVRTGSDQIYGAGTITANAEI
jgi:hypothetical protein